MLILRIHDWRIPVLVLRLLWKRSVAGAIGTMESWTRRGGVFMQLLEHLDVGRAGGWPAPPARAPQRRFSTDRWVTRPIRSPPSTDFHFLSLSRHAFVLVLWFVDSYRYVAVAVAPLGHSCSIRFVATVSASWSIISFILKSTPLSSSRIFIDCKFFFP